MSKAITRSMLWGAALVGVVFTDWAYYDVSVNHKDMLGYASVFAAAVVGAGTNRSTRRVPPSLFLLRLLRHLRRSLPAPGRPMRCRWCRQ